MHVYPDGIKAYGHERHTVPLGRRGKPVKKVRFIPAERAHALARKLQGRWGCSVARASAGRGSRPVSSWALAFPWEGRPVWSALGPVAGMGLAPPWS
jgi:hypothetical protein